MRNILILGPKLPKDGKLGGVVISFQVFLDELDRHKIPYNVIDINMANYPNYLVGLVKVIAQFIKGLFYCDHVSLHGTANAFIYIAPIASLACLLSKKPLILRKFAGDFDAIFDSLSKTKKMLVILALKNSKVTFFQTRYLVDKFEKYCRRIEWLPTSRPILNSSLATGKNYKKNLTFIGHVSQAKGIDELLIAADCLGDSYLFNIVGATNDSKYSNYEWSQHKNVQYLGQVPAQAVNAQLAQADLLIFPTKWDGEGYPGVIIEALQAGVPVIATNLKGISEIITDGIEGFLVPRADTTALINAIQKVSQDNYKELSDNAYRRGLDFSSEEVMNRYLLTIGMSEYV